MSYKLPNNSIVNGDGYTVINEVQYPLYRMSKDELTAIGVTYISPTDPIPYDPLFYSLAPDNVTVVQNSISDIKAGLKQRVASARWDAENAGVSWNGHLAQTDRDSRSIYVGMVVAVTLGVRTDNSTYKFMDGFAAVPNTSVISLAQTVADYIQRIYNVEATTVSNIDACTTFQQLTNITWSFV